MVDDHDTIIKIQEHVIFIKETIEKIDKTLNGNGQEGICHTVLRHDGRLTDLESHRSKREQLIIIIVGFIVSAGVLLMTVLNYFKIT
jgi:hypothetical protein